MLWSEQFIRHFGDGPTNLGVEPVPGETDCAVVEPDEVVLPVLPSALATGLRWT
jgi:hypothetical protein